MGLTEPLLDRLLKSESFSNAFDLSMFFAIAPAQGILLNCVSLYHAVIFYLFTKD